MEPIVKIAITILIPLIISLIICLVWRSKMKTAKLARTADNYIPQGGFNLKVQTDTFLYRTTKRVKVQSAQK